MQVLRPPFSELKSSAHLPDLGIQIAHRLQVRTHALRFVQPSVLACMALEQLSFPRHEIAGVNEEFGRDKLVCWSAIAVGLGMVDSDVL